MGMNNPLDSYRRTQREIRKHFDEFTRTHCEACPTPCCRKPARILPTDILLAEASGWKTHLLPETLQNVVQECAGALIDALHNPPESGEGELAGTPCDFLATSGCTFPNDLRPFGCTTFICKYMYEDMDRATLKKVKRLTKDLEEKHTILVRNLIPVKRR